MVRLTVLLGPGPPAIEARGRINRWITAAEPSHYRTSVSPPTVLTDWRVAVERVRKEQERHILILLDPTTEVSRAIRNALQAPIDTLHWRAGGPESAPLTSAERSPVYWNVSRSLTTAIRKRVLAHKLHGRVEFRRLKEESDLRQYFALRYEVWKKKGYLESHRDLPEVGWEVDCSDRRSLPIGAFGPGGDILGCVRVVLDREIRAQVVRIEEVLREREHEGIGSCFRAADGLEQPFDVLDSFPRFREFYHKWQRDGVSRAEISRVIVEPSARNAGIGEALVDFALSQVPHVAVTFLACVQAHEHLYAASGFTRIPGLECREFAAVHVPAIAMWRRRRSSDV